MLRWATMTLCILFGVGLAGSAAAALIDPGLQDALAGKAAGERVRVLMLFEDHADLAPVEAGLGKNASFEARRDAVISTLQAHAALTHGEALDILATAERSGEAVRVRSLWFANAIAFEGTRQVIETLAATKAAATLIHDKHYDMISNVMGPEREVKPAAGGDPQMQPNSPAVPDTVWNVKHINANRVWLDTGYTGNGILVGHFDTGVWLTHPDLANRLYVNPGEIPGNGIDDDLNGYVDDIHGYDFGNDDSNPNDDVSGGAYNHGTHTAGTVCGDGSGGTITGVAPGASILVCKVYETGGSGAAFSAIFEGQQYAVMMHARVFTMSLGIACDVALYQLMRTERLNANALRAAGVLLFNSAGNDHYACNPPDEIGLTARVPAPWIAPTAEVDPVPYSSTSGVVAVGGTGYMNDAAYTSSSRGPVNWGTTAPWNDWPYSPGPGLVKPDVTAPGVNVNSCQKPSGYSGDTWSGTSMSCPHAAGLAALLLEKNPSLSPAGIDSIMEQNAVELGIIGKDNTFGSGRINALAAVNAVPLATTPHLILTDVTILDASGDGVIDPGENFDLVFELTNNSLVVDATSVTAGLAVVANPYVTVTDNAGSFPNIAMGGGTGDNSGNVFSLNAAAGAPQGYVFDMFLTVYAQNGYQVTFDLDLFIGLPEWLDHDIGGVHLTVTDQGIIGYLSSDQIEGNGFGPIDAGTHLFIGSFWAGTDVNYICNNDYGGDAAEWVVVEDPNGRVQNLGPDGSDQTYRAIFSDAGHSAPKPLVVTRRSLAWADPPNDRFVVMEYTVQNEGATTVTNYHVGIFCDFDIGDYATNEGSVDASRGLSYLHNADSSVYCGIAVLGDSPVRNLSMISNPTYVYPNGYIDDGFKSRFLKAIISVPTTTGPDDWSCVSSSGPYTLAPGESITVPLALVYGESLAELQANTDAANAVLSVTPVADGVPAQPFALAQNRPNPFNPSTTIKFNMEKPGHVQISVFDLSGRKIKTLASRDYTAGEHAVTWDGTDEAGARMPSGMYVYRYESGDKSLARKMMLVK